jgi:glycosyltransferase involved in cell wall biosynthesis
MTGEASVLVVAVHDGFYGYGTGAGRSNRSFLEVLCELLDPSVRLTVLPVRLVPDSAEYDAAWHKGSVALVESVRGSIIPIDNGTAGQTRFGNLGNFRQASDRAAAEIATILAHSAHGLAVAFDAPFFGIAPALAQHAARTVNVARATAALHAPGDRDRVEWERRGLLATARAGGRIAATSQYIRQHLTSAYGISPPAIIDLINGLTPGESRPGTPGEDASLLPPAASRRFMLCFGRAEPYKGFDDLIDALAILKAAGVPVPHTVLGAVTDGLAITPYQRHLAERIKAEDLSVTLHTSFSPGFRSLLTHPGLAAVIVPSRTEPFGRIPLEAYEAGASPVVATTAGGLSEIVTEGRTGYTASPADPGSLASAISRALAADPVQRQQLLAVGQQIARACYDYRANVAAFLTAAAPWAIGAAQST